MKIDELTWKNGSALALLTLFYIVVGKFALTFASINASASPVWPTTGLAIAALLILGQRIWPAVLIGAFFVNLTTAGNVLTSIVIAIGNTLEGLVAMWLILRYTEFSNLFDSPIYVTKYVVFAGLIATALSATIGTTTLVLSTLAPWGSFGIIWLTWWLGDMGGALVVAPVILLWWTNHTVYPIYDTRWLAFFLYCALLFVSGFVVFYDIMPYPYVAMPALLWAAFEFGQRETAFGVLYITILAVFATINGHGPFIVTPHNMNHSLLLLQLFVCILSAMKLIVAAAVAQQKKIKKQLLNRERYFRALIEKSSDAIALIDVSATILYASPSTTKILGFTPQEIIGLPGLSLVSPEDVKGTLSTLQSIQKHTGATAVREVRVKRKDGTIIWVEFTVQNLLNDPAVGAVVVNYRDITDRKEAEANKDDFFTITTHQLRTPLSTIRWQLESMLSDTHTLPKRIQVKLQRIYASDLRMISQVNELLETSRVVRGKVVYEPVKMEGISAIVNHIDEFKSSAQKKAIVLTMETPKLKRVPLFIDPKLLSGVIQNILSNAIKYTASGGTITTAIHKEGKNLRVTITDTGIGIPKNEQHRLFSKFFRASNGSRYSSDGTGLGLFIAKSYITRWGGTLTIESPTLKTGGGTNVHFTIPL